MADLSFVDLDEYCELPRAYIAEAGQAFVNRQISLLRGSIYNRLRRLYSIDSMVQSEPDIIKLWIAALVVLKIYRKRGIDPTDLQFQEFKEQAAFIEQQIDAAANAESGLYDLPLLNSNESAKRKIKVLSSNQADPGAWKRVQQDRAFIERLRPRTY